MKPSADLYVKAVRRMVILGWEGKFPNVSDEQFAIGAAHYILRRVSKRVPITTLEALAGEFLRAVRIVRQEIAV
jgi:hypothetical protein